jgi:hypothetical protein
MVHERRIRVALSVWSMYRVQRTYCTCVLTAHAKSVLRQYIQYKYIFVLCTKCPSVVERCHWFADRCGKKSFHSRFPLPFPLLVWHLGLLEPPRAASTAVLGTCSPLVKLDATGACPERALRSHVPPPESPLPNAGNLQGPPYGLPGRALCAVSSCRSCSSSYPSSVSASSRASSQAHASFSQSLKLLTLLCRLRRSLPFLSKATTTCAVSPGRDNHKPTYLPAPQTSHRCPPVALRRLQRDRQFVPVWSRGIGTSSWTFHSLVTFCTSTR